jgi:hypothetical protein
MGLLVSCRGGMIWLSGYWCGCITVTLTRSYRLSRANPSREISKEEHEVLFHCVWASKLASVRITPSWPNIAGLNFTRIGQQTVIYSTTRETTT